MPKWEILDVERKPNKDHRVTSDKHRFIVRWKVGTYTYSDPVYAIDEFDAYVLACAVLQKDWRDTLIQKVVEYSTNFE